ncbi:MAG: hypothetical protein K9N09_04895 [Candidatus Cloacimonetes bacterium]|nr:hypothetical protein [Candidatus Cloacimonadota bacterium]MCF7813926.1 hypothetical protein [Candidatus Cloacimonadota bacterium]MCF7868020.1 hypothetical protein [Candidatus Cloacimonadota bacterium]MCF7884772.1 hypothetical protein [Candidatus Cloacimonadota bacterium]
MRKILIVLIIIFSCILNAEIFNYEDSWNETGFRILENTDSKIKLNYSIQNFELSDFILKGETTKVIPLPGVFLPNDAGMPNLPGSSRYLAIPQNSKVEISNINFRKETISNIEIAPAPRIPLDTEDGPLEYTKNEQVYNSDSFYPESFIQISKPSKIRGIDVLMLGITPFQYNPVTKELIVYRDIEVEISIIGGNGQIGEDRLRSRWWDNILYDSVLNSDVIPEVDYNNREVYRDGAEYLIICPNDPDFLAWADSIKTFRQKQGISTMIVTTTEVGGNTVSAIENYVNNAYNNWTTPPAAVLLLGDYGTVGNTVVSPIWNSYCVSDNIFADVNGNNMPDIVFARMTAQNEIQLQTMITKFLNYERNPPTDPNFYDHPITALGWQTERWFQICSEVVGGYFREVHGKNPVRINAIYSGTPGSTWSTATNTSTVVNYFGPSGVGYIPATPAELGGWSGGTASDVVNAINNGSFILQHRDHGYEQGWGEPSFNSSSIDNLTNTDLSFIFSINCLTGKYNMSGECFTEKFHRYTYNGENSGALGLIAASEVSYSFVNDVYVWGMSDNMWPDFMPSYGTTPDSRDVLPAFGNAAGKYFLAQSSWPYNTNNKEVTYHLFHHHGDAFSTVYSEVPQNISVSHYSTIPIGSTSFNVTADEGSFIALTIDGEILGTADGTGSQVSISIPAIGDSDVLFVTITKQNYYRYEAEIQTVNPADITVSPTSISENLTPDQQSQRTLSISNDGQAGSILYYEILINSDAERNIKNLSSLTKVQLSNPLNVNSIVPVKLESVTSTDATTLKYHDGLAYIVGFTNPGDINCAARFTSTELSSYYTSNEITQVKMVIYTSDFTNCTVKVWEGGHSGNPGPLVYSQDITGSVNIGGWTSHTLSTPIQLISGNEYWVGYSLNYSGSGNPFGADDGPLVVDKGGWYQYNIGSWAQITSSNLNWCIEFVVEESFANLTLTSPNGAEVWAAGTSQNITWNHSGAALANVKLEYSVDNGTSYTDIISSTPNDGSYSWNVADVNSSNCLIRISDPNDPDINDVSNANFRIYGPVDWLTINSSSGSLNQGETDGLILDFDTTGLSTGTYNANIEISSNDQDEPLINVPVSLIVSPSQAATPTGIAISIDESNSILSWNVVADAQVYKIYAADSPDGTFQLMGTSTTISYDISTITDSKKFFYVTADNEAATDVITTDNENFKKKIRKNNE